MSNSNEKKEKVEINAKPEVIAKINYDQFSKKKVSLKVTLGILVTGLIASSFFLTGNKTRIPDKINPVAEPNVKQGLSSQFDDDYDLSLIHI